MNHEEHDEKSEASNGEGIERREVLKAAITLGLGLSAANMIDWSFAQQQTETDPKKMPPQPGDWFVFSQGSEKGKLVTVDDIPMGGPQVFAWPAKVSSMGDNPEIQVVRDGNRQNEVLLARFSEDAYDGSTKQYTTADGVVAYAATCTHQCCIVSDWEAQQGLLHCPCHGSEYNPLNGAKPQPGSPAPRPLPTLPLKKKGTNASYPEVADGFRTQVGCGPIRH